MLDYIKVSKVIGPECGFTKEEETDIDTSLQFYECVNCGKVVTPFRDDCCIFCSYGDVPCPSVQMEIKCCH